MDLQTAITNYDSSRLKKENNLVRAVVKLVFNVTFCICCDKQ